LVCPSGITSFHQSLLIANPRLIWEQVAGTADFAVRVFPVAIIATVPYSIAVSKLRRPFLSDRYFFTVVRLLRRREKFTEPDFALLARAFNRARALHRFYLTEKTRTTGAVARATTGSI
jgi:hypothetical protein